MKALFAISVTAFLLVILYASRFTVYDLYSVYQLTLSQVICLFFALDAIIVSLILTSVNITARLIHRLLNGDLDVAEPEFNPLEEYLEV